MSIEYQPDDLIAELRRDGQRMVNAYFRPNGNVDLLIDTSVEGNTFRGFPRQQPARVFREWADSRYTLARIADLGEIRLQESMDDLIRRRSADLTDYWRAQTRIELPFGPCRKLVNLLHKSLLRADVIDDPDRKRVIPLLHVPHDSFCLAAVRQAAASGRFGVTMTIPRNATMGFITSEGQYEEFQQLLRAVAREAEVPPIAIDLFAWDRNHGRL